MNLYEKLEEYGRSDYYPFHMPGHKRNTRMLTAGNPYQIDITEIDGFDDLHAPEGILREEMERARRLFGAEETCFLINGSSCGLLAAISACTRHGEEILVARNCHKSVYHAIWINALRPHYIYPQLDSELGISLGILPEQVDTFLGKHPGIRTVVVVSPTYEGVTSDIQGIAEVVHRHKGILIVDEAHGAHFAFHSEFPSPAVELGADIVIQSIHKTLPAFTQTALAHLQGSRVDRKQFQKFLSVFQSSSPSYLLLAGISRCLSFLEREGKASFAAYVGELQDFYKRMAALQKISLWSPAEGFERDCSKLVLSVKNTSMTGRQFYDILLHRYHLQMEMAQDSYVLAMTSVLDTKEGLQRLSEALLEIDAAASGNIDGGRDRLCPEGEKPELVLTPYEAALRATEQVDLAEAVDKTAGGFVYLYPPGIPLLCPGEQINSACIRRILYYKDRGLSVRGVSEENLISVIKESRTGK